MLPDSTNPRVIADNIKKLDARPFAGVIANPEGEAVDSLEKIDINGEIYEISSYTPPQFSTDEFDTGKKWIDGSKIYGKIFDLKKSDFTAADSNKFYSYVPTISGVSQYVYLDGIVYVTGFGRAKLGARGYGVATAATTDYYEYDCYYGGVCLHSTSSNINLGSTDFTAIYYVEYTKEA